MRVGDMSNNIEDDGARQRLGEMMRDNGERVRGNEARRMEMVSREPIRN